MDGSPNDRDPEKAGSFFVGHALLPVPDEFKFQYHVQPTVVKAADASPGHARRQGSLHPGERPARRAGVGAGRLRPVARRVRQGRPRAVDHVRAERREGRVQPAARRRRVEPAADGTGRRRSTSPKDTPLFPDPNSIDEKSFLARFKLSANDPFLQLRDAFVLKAIGVVEPKADQLKDAGRVLMRFNDGRPALRRQAGRATAKCCS